MMIITEHGEVIFESQKELLDLLEQTYTQGALNKIDHPQLPVAWLCSTYISKEIIPRLKR